MCLFYSSSSYAPFQWDWFLRTVVELGNQLPPPLRPQWVLLAHALCSLPEPSARGLERHAAEVAARTASVYATTTTTTTKTSSSSSSYSSTHYSTKLRRAHADTRRALLTAPRLPS